MRNIMVDKTHLFYIIIFQSVPMADGLWKNWTLLAKSGADYVSLSAHSSQGSVPGSDWVCFYRSALLSVTVYFLIRPLGVTRLKHLQIIDVPLPKYFVFGILASVCSSQRRQNAGLSWWPCLLFGPGQVMLGYRWCIMKA